MAQSLIHQRNLVVLVLISEAEDLSMSFPARNLIAVTAYRDRGLDAFLQGVRRLNGMRIFYHRVIYFWTIMHH